MGGTQRKKARNLVTWVVLALAVLIVVAAIILLTKVSGDMTQYVFMGAGLLILNLVFVLYFTRRNFKK
jgi:hypothetical protein